MSNPQSKKSQEEKQQEKDQVIPPQSAHPNDLPKVDPPPAPTNMTAPAKGTKMVKIKALRPCQLSDGRFLKENETADVTEEEAKIHCKKYRGSMPFAGERILSPHEQKKGWSIVKAVRLPQAS